LLPRDLGHRSKGFDIQNIPNLITLRPTESDRCDRVPHISDSDRTVAADNNSTADRMKADTITGGDDLEDDLDLQPDFMAASDVEDDDEGDAIMSNGDEEDLPNPAEAGDAADFLSDDEEDSGVPNEAVGKKRKAEEERPTNAGSSGGPSTALSDADKKKKRKLKEKERKEKVGQLKYCFGLFRSPSPTLTSSRSLCSGKSGNRRLLNLMK
jgi:hypothetical protein